MRLSRLVPVLATGALFVASTSPVQAQSEPVTGVGATTGALTLLGLDAGDLLTLDLLSDSGLANIDEATGLSRAAAQIAALTVDSAAAGVSREVPLLQVESTGEPQTTSQAVSPISNPVLSGAIAPLDLSAAVDEGGATSLLSAGLGQLDVLSGILSLAGSSVDLGSTALVGEAAGTRGVDVDALTVLDLEALLGALGIPLADLPLDTLLGLLDGLGLLGQLEAILGPLGVDIDGLSPAQITSLVRTTGGTISTQVDTAQATVESLEDLVADLSTATPTCTIVGPVVGVVDGILGGGNGSGTGTTVCEDLINGGVDVIDDLTDEIAVLVDQVQDLLDQLLAILDAPLDLLSGLALLSLDGLDVSVATKATDDVGTSVADVTGTLGSLQVGELPVLGALDLTAPTDQLNGLLGQAEGLVGGILGQISPALSDLVSIRTMQETTSVEQVGDSVVSSASFSGLEVDVAGILPAELTALLGTIAAGDSLTDIADGLGLDLELPTAGATQVLQLNELLSTVTGGLPLLAALEDGLGLQVATLSQQSTFTPFAASTPVAPGTPGAPGAPAGPAASSPTLPRTGSDDTLLLALAGIAVLAALGGRQLVRRSDGDA